MVALQVAPQQPQETTASSVTASVVPGAAGPVGDGLLNLSFVHHHPPTEASSPGVAPGLPIVSPAGTPRDNNGPIATESLQQPQFPQAIVTVNALGSTASQVLLPKSTTEQMVADNATGSSSSPVSPPSSPRPPQNSATAPSTVAASSSCGGGGGMRLNKFVRRLHDMLQSEQHSGIVEWRRGLLVLHSTDAFAKTILPKYFNTRNFKTFRRQLNYYGFVHVRSFSTTGSTTTALWVNRDLAKKGTSHISSVLMLKRVEPCDSAKTAEGRRVRKELAVSTVEDDIGVSAKSLQLDQIRTTMALARQQRRGDGTEEAAAPVPLDAPPPPIPLVVHCHPPQATGTTTTTTAMTTTTTYLPLLPAKTTSEITSSSSDHNSDESFFGDEENKSAANLLLLLSKGTN